MLNELNCIRKVCACVCESITNARTGEINVQIESKKDIKLKIVQYFRVLLYETKGRCSRIYSRKKNQAYKKVKEKSH